MKGSIWIVLSFVAALLSLLGWLLFRPSEFRSIRLPDWVRTR
ncbi:MAG TPA: hypothetical protein VMC09_10660 [Anaerolineales bacterium]|nr:hypothetical protein [Anaerolineales bacterium]